LFIGAAVWGVAGMILFLPFVAMLKVVCEEYEELKPVAFYLGY
jgi:predicted PurR-regulated permease PerM